MAADGPLDLVAKQIGGTPALHVDRGAFKQPLAQVRFSEADRIKPWRGTGLARGDPDHGTDRAVSWIFA